MNRDRIDYLDTAKGILIMLVILGHIFYKSKYMYFAYTFHLSSFLIITGILFHYTNRTNRPLLLIIKNAIYTLIIPLVFFEAIGSILKVLSNDNVSLFDLVINPLKGVYHVPSDWYLFTVFFAELIFVCIEKTLNHKYTKYFLYSMLYVVGVVLPRDRFRFVLVSRILIAVLLIAVGYYMYNFFTTMDIHNLFFSFIIVCLCTMFNGYVSLYSISIGNPVLYIVGAVFGAYFCISLSHLIANKPISFFGKNSLILMGTHEVCMPLIPTSGILLFASIIIVEIPIIIFLSHLLPFCVGIKSRHKVKQTELKKNLSH